eukprot:2873285-Amphidinium_carterae.1
MKTKHGWSSQQCLRAAQDWAPEVERCACQTRRGEKKMLSHASAEYLACVAHFVIKAGVPLSTEIARQLFVQ